MPKNIDCKFYYLSIWYEDNNYSKICGKIIENKFIMVVCSMLMLKVISSVFSLIYELKVCFIWVGNLVCTNSKEKESFLYLVASPTQKLDSSSSSNFMKL